MVEALLVAAVLLLLVLVALQVRHLLSRPSAPPAVDMLQNQMNASVQQTNQQLEALRKTLTDSIQTLSGQVSQSVAESNKTVGDRLDNTTKIVGDVRQQLGRLELSSRQMLEVGKDIAKLEDILQPPKLRGALGELFLADLLAQILPAEHYRMQYQFKGGETVDAVIMLRAGMVPIDAKFPLENFRRIMASDGDDQRKAARKAFVRDVKGHIDSIAAKYIRMDENTFDFALMYIPAENVYYETIIKDDEFGGEMALFGYALKKRVIPVSPNSFYAYLQTIILGLRGMRVEEKSREILELLSRVRKELDRFQDAFRLVGQHLDNSLKKHQEAQKRFEKVEFKLDQVDGLAQGLQQGEAAASHAALLEGSDPEDL